MTDLPNGWQSGTGEANRPIHEGGYYLHYYVRVLPGSNQHVTKTMDLSVDTANNTQSEGPKQHVICLRETARDDDGLIHETHHALKTIDVEERNDPIAQRAAEEEAHEYARELMRECP